MKGSPQKKKCKYFVFFFSGTYQQPGVASEKHTADVDIKYSVCPVAISVRRLNSQPPLQKRNWRPVTLISRRNCWTFERSFYFVFSLDDWYWNDEVRMMSGVLEFVICNVWRPPLRQCRHQHSYYFRVWTNCTDENWQWLQWSSRILIKRKHRWPAETQLDNAKTTLLHLKQVGHNLVKLWLNFPLFCHWLQHSS